MLLLMIEDNEARDLRKSWALCPQVRCDGLHVVVCATVEEPQIAKVRQLHVHVVERERYIAKSQPAEKAWHGSTVFARKHEHVECDCQRK